MSHAIAFLLGYALSALILIFPVRHHLDNLQAEAVKRGAAEWVVDQGTGETEFQWKEVKP